MLVFIYKESEKDKKVGTGMKKSFFRYKESKFDRLKGFRNNNIYLTGKVSLKILVSSNSVSLSSQSKNSILLFSFL